MSLILDALNRAEQERKRQDQVPDIHTIHLSPAMSLGKAARRRRLIIVGGLLLILVIIGLCVWLLRSSEPKPLEQMVATPSIPAPPLTAPAQLQHPITNPAVQVPAAEADAIPKEASVPTPVQQQAPADTVKADINNLYAAEPEAEVKEASTPGPVAELYKEEAPTESEAVSNPFPDAEPALEPLPEVKIRSLAEFPNLPFFNDLPWNQKQQIPTISYSRHNYSPSSISSVVINGATRGIGNLVPGEFIIEDIVADGVVLRYKDKVFKLTALNGWVNM